MKSKGYQNFWQDLNARDYGIPQNRMRCFMVSILTDGYVGYEFPKPVELKTVMKDYLENDVDEKYYINSEKANKLIAELIERGELPQATGNRQQATGNRNYKTVDLCVKSPREISVANCIKARYDVGISNFHADGSGVVEQSRHKV